MPPRSKLAPQARLLEISLHNLEVIRFNIRGREICRPERAVIESMLRASAVESCRLSVVFLEGSRMRALNRKALGHDYVTDVVTFDLGSLGRHLEGEIYVCPGEAKRNACQYGEPFDKELLRYIAHGILHLSGHDDSTEKERSRMREEEDRLLKAVKLLWP